MNTSKTRLLSSRVAPIALTLGTLALGSAFGSHSSAWAQPGGNGGGNDGQQMTPAQMAQRRAQREAQQLEARNSWIRQTLTATGFADEAVQDAVIAFMASQEKARAALQEQARQMSTSLIDPLAKNADLKTQLDAFRAAVAADNTRYNTELTALDATIKYSTQPRLEALLTILGILGPEVSSIGGVGEIFPQSPFGRAGGMGRGQGGQGRGGQGQGPGGRGGRGGQGQGREGGGPGGGGPGGGDPGGGQNGGPPTPPGGEPAF